MLTIIIEEETDVNAKNSQEETPLALAIQKEQTQVVRLLRKTNTTEESAPPKKNRSFNLFNDICNSIFSKTKTKQ